MKKTIEVKPSRFGALSFWAGSDHYSLRQAIQRRPFLLPINRVSKVYEIRARPLIGLGSEKNFALEYESEHRQCFVTMEALPAELAHIDREVVSPPGAMQRLFDHFRREPTVLFLPLIAPVGMGLVIFLYSLWNEYVLQNSVVLQFFAKPGCETSCVKQVLQIHSLVALLFFMQVAAVILPFCLLWFQAPRYRSVVNYRVSQGYSFAGLVVGVVIFAQLMLFFPFRQYGRFVEMGFGPKVEKLLSNLKNRTGDSKTSM